MRDGIQERDSSGSDVLRAFHFSGIPTFAPMRASGAFHKRSGWAISNGPNDRIVLIFSHMSPSSERRFMAALRTMMQP
jgi:hypothetical protein